MISGIAAPVLDGVSIRPNRFFASSNRLRCGSCHDERKDQS